MTDKKNVWMGGKTNVFNIPPENLTLITDKDHPLYDPRVERKPPDTLVANIMHLGVIQPITVVKDGPNAIVVDGRQRTLAAIEANKLLKKSGGDQIKVPCFKRAGEDTGLLGLMISTNEHRHDDDPLFKAQKLQRFLEIGGTEDDAAIHFGVSKATVKMWSRVLELSAPVKTAIKKGQISASAASRLASMTAAEQKDALAEMLESGQKPTVKNTEAKARKEKVEKGAIKVRTKSEITGMAEMLKGTHLEDLFKWLLGEEGIDWDQYGVDWYEEEEGETPPKKSEPKLKVKNKNKLTDNAINTNEDSEEW
jgi:ParB family chromosome partitioning protein